MLIVELKIGVIETDIWRSEVIPLIEQQLEPLHTACRRHRLARLEVFGSAAGADAFDSSHGDVDFIVLFLPGTNLGPWLAEYLDLRVDLERVLGRPVDLVMQSAMRNPYFLQEANKTRKVIYADDDAEAA